MRRSPFIWILGKSLCLSLNYFNVKCRRCLCVGKMFGTWHVYMNRASEQTTEYGACNYKAGSSLSHSIPTYRQRSVSKRRAMSAKLFWSASIPPIDSVLFYSTHLHKIQYRTEIWTRVYWHTNKTTIISEKWSAFLNLAYSRIKNLSRSSRTYAQSVLCFTLLCCAHLLFNWLK